MQYDKGKYDKFSQMSSGAIGYNYGIIVVEKCGKFKFSFFIAKLNPEYIKK